MPVEASSGPKTANDVPCSLRPKPSTGTPLSPPEHTLLWGGLLDQASCHTYMNIQLSKKLIKAVNQNMSLFAVQPTNPRNCCYYITLESDHTQGLSPQDSAPIRQENPATWSSKGLQHTYAAAHASECTHPPTSRTLRVGTCFEDEIVPNSQCSNRLK